MDRTDTSRIRKRLMSEQSSTPPETPGEIDIASHATLAYSSEDHTLGERPAHCDRANRARVRSRPAGLASGLRGAPSEPDHRSEESVV
jgi:hypothetical protein